MRIDRNLDGQCKVKLSTIFPRNDFVVQFEIDLISHWFYDYGDLFVLWKRAISQEKGHMQVFFVLWERNLNWPHLGVFRSKNWPTPFELTCPSPHPLLFSSTRVNRKQDFDRMDVGSAKGMKAGVSFHAVKPRDLGFPVSGETSFCGQVSKCSFASGWDVTAVKEEILWFQSHQRAKAQWLTKLQKRNTFLQFMLPDVPFSNENAVWWMRDAKHKSSTFTMSCT